MRPWGHSYITDTGSRKSWSFVRKTFLGFRDDGFAKVLNESFAQGRRSTSQQADSVIRPTYMEESKTPLPDVELKDERGNVYVCMLCVCAVVCVCVWCVCASILTQTWWRQRNMQGLGSRPSLCLRKCAQQELLRGQCSR